MRSCRSANADRLTVTNTCERADPRLVPFPVLARRTAHSRSTARPRGGSDWTSRRAISLRWAPGETHEVTLVAYGGGDAADA